MVQRCLVTKVSVNLNNMYAQEFGAKSVFYLNWPTFFGEPIFYFSCLLSVSVCMKSKSGLYWELDIRTYIV